MLAITKISIDGLSWIGQNLEKVILTLGKIILMPVDWAYRIGTAFFTAYVYVSNAYMYISGYVQGFTLSFWQVRINP